MPHRETARIPPASVIGNTVTVLPANGLGVGTTKDGGVWIAILGSAETAQNIAEMLNRLFAERERDAPP